MTDREEFEAWYRKMYQSNGMNVDSLRHKNEMLGCFEYATEQSQKEIAEKDARIAELEKDNDDYLKALAACRDVFEPNDEINNFDAVSDPLCVADYVKEHFQSIAKAQAELEAEVSRLNAIIEDIKVIDNVFGVDDKDGERYRELIYAVHSVYPNETRHETALRYIKSAQQGSNAMQEVEAK